MIHFFFFFKLKLKQLGGTLQNWTHKSLKVFQWNIKMHKQKEDLEP